MFPLLIFVISFAFLWPFPSQKERRISRVTIPLLFGFWRKPWRNGPSLRHSRQMKLAQLHFYSINKREGDRTIEFRITVREYATPNHLNMRFFAEADKHTNQKTAPYTPCGWGQTLLQALADCVKAIHRFPYEGE